MLFHAANKRANPGVARTLRNVRAAGIFPTCGRSSPLLKGGKREAGSRSPSCWVAHVFGVCPREANLNLIYFPAADFSRRGDGGPHLELGALRRVHNGRLRAAHGREPDPRMVHGVSPLWKDEDDAERAGRACQRGGASSSCR